jgi:GTP-binding protein HflX
MKTLKDRLQQLKRQRQTQRRARRRSRTLAVSLVGYTNAGKSTLFNKLTHSNTYAADQLFATLDTTTRRLFIPSGETAVISDTVGFIRDLPHSLVASFHATLEETTEADLLLHVVDINHPDKDQQIKEVQKVLAEIDADLISQVLILNKCDVTGIPSGIERDEYGRITQIRLSAKTGDGSEFIRLLLTELAESKNLLLSQNASNHLN